MNWLQRMMYGRYGVDALSIALIVTGGVLSSFGAIFGIWWLSLLGDIPVILCVVRILSRDTLRRRQENERFLRFWMPLQEKMAGMIRHQQQHRYYRFFTCPQCRQKLRLPKGKGKITITCPKCGKQFDKRT